jgi:hypothetical protein
MFHRIEMNVINVPSVVFFVAQDMLPIPPLPNAALGFAGAAR